MLLNGQVVSKHSYLRMFWLQHLKNNLSSCSFDMDKIFYSREGSNICHDFALNPERLSEVLEVFQDEDPELFSMLLLPDKHEKSAFDIALDNQSPKCLELMLSKLATLTTFKCSHLVLDRLDELIAMDL